MSVMGVIGNVLGWLPDPSPLFPFYCIFPFPYQEFPKPVRSTLAVSKFASESFPREGDSRGGRPACATPPDVIQRLVIELLCARTGGNEIFKVAGDGP